MDGIKGKKWRFRPLKEFITATNAINVRERRLPIGI
jgi:hypothetical protein